VSLRGGIRSRGALSLAVVLLAPLVLVSALFAAPKKGTAPPKKKPPISKIKDASPGETTEAAAVSEANLSDAPPTGKAPAAKGESGELLKESEKKEGDASVKVFEFGQTEIEGRARWPAVTYFVRRMRAEFEAQKLPHRPFLPELESTKGDPAVK
jgi:hypothetical protein